MLEMAVFGQDRDDLGHVNLHGILKQKDHGFIDQVIFGLAVGLMAGCDQHARSKEHLALLR